jgi:hypothetical protein
MDNTEILLLYTCFMNCINIIDNIVATFSDL